MNKYYIQYLYIYTLLKKSKIYQYYREFDIREAHVCTSTESGCDNVIVSLPGGSVSNHDLRATHAVCAFISSQLITLCVVDELVLWVHYNSNWFSTLHLQIKSINSNPVRPDYIAVGAHDDVARVYDRRMISRTSKVSSKRSQRYLAFQISIYKLVARSHSYIDVLLSGAS